MWQSSGVLDYILLMGKDKVNIRDLFVVTVLEDVYQTATLDIGVDIHNTSDQEINRVVVRAVVQDPDGVILTSGSSRLIGHMSHLEPKTQYQLHLSMHVKRPVVWSMDTPHMYSLLLILEDSHGRILDAVVREFSIKKPSLIMNASPLCL